MLEMLCPATGYAFRSSPEVSELESSHRFDLFARPLMSGAKNRYDLAIETAEKLYHERIKGELGDALNGQWVVIDVNTGEYEVDEDGYVALEALEARVTEVDHVFVRDEEFLPGHLGGLAKVLWSNIPQEEKDGMPHDGSLNYKHYLYGFPKRDKYPWQA